MCQEDDVKMHCHKHLQNYQNDVQGCQSRAWVQIDSMNAATAGNGQGPVCGRGVPPPELPPPPAPERAAAAPPGRAQEKAAPPASSKQRSRRGGGGDAITSAAAKTSRGARAAAPHQKRPAAAPGLDSQGPTSVNSLIT